ncbi:Heat shock 70 kDa protein [Tritrichomonas musculus]|uniref:Heat shock 70 kDa protein n=1 Tax=Tritrichomonas musculus TaxID=1915356 RepID=A0ABR2JEB0_9EUKA
MSKHALGIDLGTTNSSVSIISGTGDKPELVADNSGTTCIPSIVNIAKHNDEIIFKVGEIARRRQFKFSKTTIYDTKRMLGRKYDDEEIQKIKWPFKIEKSETGGILICLEELNKKFKPYEISGEILKYMAEVGNSRFPKEERTNEVVITIPANFGEEQRAETLAAAQYAGLKVLKIINEPTSAGLAYGLMDKNASSRNVFIFDFGGGTLDVSLLYIDGSQIKVKDTDGNQFLGGRDFDEKTVDYFIEKLGLDSYRNNAQKRSKLREAVIKTKIELSISNFGTLISEDGDFIDYELTLKEFEEINKDLIIQIIEPVKRLLTRAKVEPNHIKDIIIVGGSAKMQFVKRILTEYFGKEPYSGIDPASAVAMGAAIIAAKTIQDINLTNQMKKLEYEDICAFSIGTSTHNGTMAVIISKGDHIPIKRDAKFHTILYRQDTFVVDIYEGESKFIKNNTYLGEFSISNIPASEDEVEFIIEFSMDQNNILSASARLVGGNLYGEATIKIEKSKLKDQKDQIKIKERDSPDNRIVEVKLFYKNIQRFINFNKEELLKYYSKYEIDRYFQEAKFNEENPDNALDIEPQISIYTKFKFKKYFHFHPNLPRFLR